MTGYTWLAILILGPPAIFGITILVDDWVWMRRSWRFGVEDEAERQAAKRRHPSSWSEDDL